MPTNKSVKRGARPSPRSEIAAATPHLPLPIIPPNFIYVPKQISMWHNDVHGDCVTAEEAFAKACHQPEIFITDDEVQKWATSHDWYEGASLIEVLKAMQKTGFQQGRHTYDDGAISSVNWTDQSTLRSAICHGPVKLGVAADQLETVWHSNNGRMGWFATGFKTDTKEDHCVSLCGYGTIAWIAERLKAALPAGVDEARPAYAMFTWDSIGIIDLASMLAITQEAWLRTPTTVAVSGQ